MHTLDMPPYRFAVLAHTPEIIDYVRMALEGTPEDVRYELVDMENSVLRARACLDEGAEVVICHGGTGNAIVQALGNSAVSIARTDMDVIKALQRAGQIAHEVAFAVYHGEVHDIAEMEKLLNVHVHLVPYDSFASMKQGISAIFSQGVRVLIGGGVSSKLMDALGGVGFVIEPSLHSIYQALARARGIASQKRLERVHIEDMSAIFRQVREGVICIDENRRLIAANTLAYQTLHCADNAPESELAAYYGPLQLLAVLGDGMPRRESLTKVAGGSLMVTTLPISMYGGKNGAVALIEEVSTLQKINRKIGEQLYSRGFVARTTLDDMQGSSTPVTTMKKRIRLFAASRAPVLIQGETGSGKERVAHALHMESPRADKPFVAVNVAALSPSLLESELFGYEDGAFTGARRGGKLGLFEMAHQGTLFLDEVGDISPELQLRLLRVLEEHEFMRVGGNKMIPVDVRLVSASHRNLAELVAQGRFRMDLYYRLATLKVRVPPLRERLDDIYELLHDVLVAHHRGQDVLSPGIIQIIHQYGWPGNIRELLATMESYLTLLGNNPADETLFREILSENSITGHEGANAVPGLNPKASLKENLECARGWYISEAVRHCKGDKKQAARMLGISYSTLWRAVGGK